MSECLQTALSLYCPTIVALIDVDFYIGCIALVPMGDSASLSGMRTSYSRGIKCLTNGESAHQGVWGGGAACPYPTSASSPSATRLGACVHRPARRTAHRSTQKHARTHMHTDTHTHTRTLSLTHAGQHTEVHRIARRIAHRIGEDCNPVRCPLCVRLCVCVCGVCV